MRVSTWYATVHSVNATIYDPDHSVLEERFVSIGESGSGRLLVVGYTERRSTIRIIFARRATSLERLDYEEA